MNRVGWKVIALALVVAMTPVAKVKAAAVNQKAPTFELDSFSGGKAGLKNGTGNVTLVNFWASWCGPCAIEFPNLNKLAAEYKEKGLKVLAINIDKDRPSAERFLTRYAKDGLALNVLLDPNAKMAAAYDAKAMPTSYIVDGKGVVRFVHVGFRPDDPAQWHQEIDSLLTEKK